MSGEVLIMGKGGVGGANLNFKIIGQTTQPTGTANTIWINTSVAITEWMSVMSIDVNHFHKKRKGTVLH